MNMWLRRAEMNKNLIIAFVVLVLGAGGFWGWKCRGTSSDVQEVRSREKSKTYTVTCIDCGTLPDKFPADKALEMKADKQGGKIKCPKCGKYSARFGKTPPVGGAGGSTESESDDEKP